MSTITVGILPPARMLAEDLTKANLRQGSPNLLQMASSGVGKQAKSESMDSGGTGRLGGAKNDKWSSSKPGALPCTPVDLAPVMVQQVAAVKIPMSRDRRSPIWPCTSLMMTSSLMTHTRFYLLRMPLLFLIFQDRILTGSTMVTFYQQRSLGFKKPTIMSQVMLGPAILVHPPRITLWIVQGTWPQDCSSLFLHTLDWY